MKRDVAVIAFSQTKHQRRVQDVNEVEMLMPIIDDVRAKAGVAPDDIGFTCSGSTDYLAGVAFSFVMTLDATGPWPPIQESHVEMDGAWALYEAWVKLQLGEVDTALIYSYGKSSPGTVGEVLTRQLDPYNVAPLWPDAISLAALQANALLDAGKTNVEEMAEVAARSRKAALGNPYAQLAWDRPAAELLDDEPIVDPLRTHDCPPITDGAAALVLAAGDKARELCSRPAWIRGIDHRIEPQALGLRDLTSQRVDPRGRRAGRCRRRRGRRRRAPRAVHAPGAHPARGARARRRHANVNPSGGALAANPIMAAGLIRIGEVAQRIIDGDAGRGVAHATSGPCLQQNLVCVLEGES